MAFASFSCEAGWRLKEVFVTGWAATMVGVTVMDGIGIEIGGTVTVTVGGNSGQCSMDSGQ